ncbi:MAG: lipid-A-disaccharide synthase LpxB [Roseibaca calidilacus]|uniref:Lipid-A-disaccharide synthase n=1 Tax=Roseibaca calidilacus TaxID=1666912 RepID=A0A0N8K7J0_9RHOB|nr:lipid-A-disaccharide synthase [Roseibaca calidilacus]KPP91873.1 MAG: lipid-A-disaccharide synthase LpxB [Roseibaca calidilacus]CUX82371.1 lipid-A-disaccharide synthase [Roseibaca calidilacus]
MNIFLIAGEPSGDALGAALMAGFAELVPGCRFAGVGGEGMAEAGLTSLFPMSDLSVMGLAEVLPRISLLRRRITQTAQAIAEQRPDLVVTIDSPDFCLRVLKRARAARPDLPVVHYVAPSVWAWRPKRAARMAPLVDHVLALLPFEPPYMQAAGMSCDFVGHPVVAAPRATQAEAQAIRQAQTVVLALPGSRGGEIARLAPRFGQALGQALPPGAQVLVPTVAAQAEHMRAQVARWPVPAQVLTESAQKRAAFRAADVALAASGTVSLELAANDTPMVIGYDMAWLTQRIAERLIKLDTVTLVNLVSETRAVPEYLGRACTADNLAQGLRNLLADPARQADQRAAMRLTMDRLGQGGDAPGYRAAASCLAFMSRKAGGGPSPVP